MSTFRWCVTGTPVGKSVNDLHGLLVFLQIDPYWAERWWRLCIFEPFTKGITKPLLDLLCKVLWRTCKMMMMMMMSMMMMMVMAIAMMTTIMTIMI